MIKVLILSVTLLSAMAELVDLSHPMDENARNWPLPGYKRFKLTTLSTADEDGFFYISKDLEMTEHIGTHMDAPYHFGKTSWDLSAIPIEKMVVPVVKIDARVKCANNRDYELTVQDLKDWEVEFGPVPENAVIIMETGWGDKYDDTEAYYGTGLDINADNFNLTQWSAEIHFPGFSAEVAVELVANYSIAGAGIDTASLDPAVSSTFPVHFTLEGSGNVYGLENLCCLEKVPAQGATMMVMAPAVVGGSGFPVRVIVDTDSNYAYNLNSGSRAFPAGILIVVLFVFAFCCNK